MLHWGGAACWLRTQWKQWELLMVLKPPFKSLLDSKTWFWRFCELPSKLFVLQTRVTLCALAFYSIPFPSWVRRKIALCLSAAVRLLWWWGSWQALFQTEAHTPAMWRHFTCLWARRFRPPRNHLNTLHPALEALLSKASVEATFEVRQGLCLTLWSAATLWIF